MNMPKNITEVLSQEEIKALLKRSNLKGWFSVATTWGLIAFSFGLVAWKVHPLTVGLALVLLGGRQLALSILMHEASHRSLFESRWLNDQVGKWLCAAPVWQRLADYRKHHMGHHNHTGTEKDPDLGLVEPFPTSKRSLFRKFFRDLTGISGLKRIYGLLLMDFGFIKYTASVNVEKIDQTQRTLKDTMSDGVSNLVPVILTNAAIFGALWAVGHGWLYSLWAIAYLTTFSLFIRIRSIAEHACTERTDNPFLNTRTTYSNPITRLTIAPHHVNYHLEHHLLMTVPHYNLPRFHRLLQEKGITEQAHVEKGYTRVLQKVILPTKTSQQVQ